MPFTTHLLAPPSPSTDPKNPPKFTLPTPTTPNPPTNPPLLTDALTIRQTVFIDEQHCSAAEEIDADDGRSWHWVVYHTADPTASTGVINGNGHGHAEPPTTTPASGGRTPVATIRLVPPPNVHEHNHNPNHNETENGAEQAPEQEQEPYIKLTRVAVRREYRGYGLGRAVVETALAWAREHAREIDVAAAAFAKASTHKNGAEVVARPVWNGLVLVHAQTQVEKMYERCGFVTDEGMGRWDENEIEHLGMWRRLVLE